MFCIGYYIIDVTFKNNRICFGIIAALVQVKTDCAKAVFKPGRNGIAEFMGNSLKINPVIVNTCKLGEKITNRNNSSPFSLQYFPDFLP